MYIFTLSGLSLVNIQHQTASRKTYTQGEDERGKKKRRKKSTMYESRFVMAFFFFGEGGGAMGEAHMFYWSETFGDVVYTCIKKNLSV